MTVREAANLIGCSTAHVRRLIANGLLKARRVPQPGQPAYRWSINRTEAERYRDLPQTKGYPRGVARNKH